MLMVLRHILQTTENRTLVYPQTLYRGFPFSHACYRFGSRNRKETPIGRKFRIFNFLISYTKKYCDRVASCTGHTCISVRIGYYPVVCRTGTVIHYVFRINRPGLFIDHAQHRFDNFSIFFHNSCISDRRCYRQIQGNHPGMI
jgi:hypothetical protein